MRTKFRNFVGSQRRKRQMVHRIRHRLEPHARAASSGPNKSRGDRLHARDIAGPAHTVERLTNGPTTTRRQLYASLSDHKTPVFIGRQSQPRTYAHQG